MFKITPIQDKATQEKICALCQTQYREGSFGYVMMDNDTGDIMGMSQFEIFGENATIYDLRPAPGYDDFEAMFILGRQTMNFIELCGGASCTVDRMAGDEKLIRAIGFKPNTDGIPHATLTGMFDGNCGHH